MDQVIRLIINFNFRVTQNTEHRCRHKLMTRIDFDDAGANHRLDQKQPRPITRQFDKTGQIRRQQDHTLHWLAVRAGQFQHHALAVIMEKRKRVGWVKRCRGDQWQNIVNEPIFEPKPVLLIIGNIQKNMDIFITKTADQFGQKLILACHQFGTTCHDLR